MIIDPSKASDYLCCMNQSVYCSGASCMAWRKEVEYTPVQFTRTDSSFPRPPKYTERETGRGFCGLAYGEKK